MRCKTILSLNNNLFKTRIHATKRDALDYKQGILESFTIREKVEYRIQVSISKA